MFTKPLTLIAILAVTSVSGCPKGFSGHGESCYNLVHVSASWAEALAYCSALGAQLAAIETPEEHAFVKAYLTNETSTIDDGVWIRGLDYLEEGTWVWGNEGGDIQNFFWGPNNPDNHKNGNIGQNCIMFSKPEQFLWDDFYCSGKQFFLCETDESMNP